VELRYFAGLSVEETAALLGMAPRSIKRDWAMARLWLFHEIRNTKE
jgi:RNA polymerase sigma-70 factor, ECF subfamily